MGSCRCKVLKNELEEDDHSGILLSFCCLNVCNDVCMYVCMYAMMYFQEGLLRAEDEVILEISGAMTN